MADTARPEQAIAVVINLRVRSGAERDFAGWQHRLDTAIATFPGFAGTEAVPPVPPIQPDWVLIHRFATREQLRGWLDSSVRHALISEAVPSLLEDESLSAIEGIPETAAPQGPVTELISMRVKPGMENAYRAWAGRVESAEARFPGFRGVRLQSPVAGVQEDWVTLLRFDSAEHLKGWRESDARRKALAEAERFVESSSRHTVSTAFDGWFALDSAGRTPARWQQAMVVLLALFPIVMLESLYLNPALRSLDPSPRTFLGNALTVTVLTWAAMPLANKGLRWWLRPNPSAPGWTAAAGAGALLTLYLALVGLFWFLAS